MEPPLVTSVLNFESESVNELLVFDISPCIASKARFWLSTSVFMPKANYYHKSGMKTMTSVLILRNIKRAGRTHPFQRRNLVKQL